MWKCFADVHKLTLLLLAICPLLASQQGARERSGNGANLPPPKAAHNGSTHGTVNVFLANRNGLVAVTDSRLSNEHGPLGSPGQKLFQVDDHTVCAIAGWYSDPGPEIKPIREGEPSYPAYLTVPGIIQAVVNKIATAKLTNEQKFQTLAETFGLSLIDIASIDRAAGIPPGTSKSEITLAGFDEQGNVEILQGDLVPRIEAGQIMDYHLVEYPVTRVSRRFVAIFRGIEGPAKAILDGTDTTTAADPILDYFETSLRRDRGDALSVEDMEQIAKAIARRTSVRFPGEVGGPLQIAELTARKVSRFVQPNPTQSDVPLLEFAGAPRTAIYFDGNNMHGSSFLPSFPPRVSFVQGSHFEDGNQALDFFIFFGTTFKRCAFSYSGSPQSIFDASNSVESSTLTLLRGADPNSNFVRRIIADFPPLRSPSSTGRVEHRRLNPSLLDLSNSLLVASEQSNSDVESPLPQRRYTRGTGRPGAGTPGVNAGGVGDQSTRRGYPEEHGGRHVESPAEPGDVVTVELALAGENQRDCAFAAKVRSNITLRERIPFEQITQHIGRLCLGDRIALRLKAFDQQSYQLDGRLLIRRGVGLCRQVEERICVFSQFRV